MEQTKKLMLLTDEQEREFERLKLRVRRKRDEFIPELLTLLGILRPDEAQKLYNRRFTY